MKHRNMNQWVEVMVKGSIFFYLFTFLPLNTCAQPKQRRVQQSEQQQRKNPSSAMSVRAQISFPTAVEMPEEVVWRRDIYRELDLSKDANAGLYYPVEPQGKQLNLFTYIFKLAQNGYIPVYEYPTDGSDVFTDDSKVDMKTIEVLPEGECLLRSGQFLFPYQGACPLSCDVA